MHLHATKVYLNFNKSTVNYTCFEPVHNYRLLVTEIVKSGGLSEGRLIQKATEIE
jgi:hypothetical protein